MKYEKGISIIIPVYNSELYLSRCFYSVLTQTCKDLEIICVLDNKTDDKSKDILEHYAREDNRVKIIEDTTGKGQGYNRNLGIEAATKEYIAFLDSDDYVDISYYEQMINASKMFDSDVVMSDMVIISKGEQETIKEKKHRFHAEYLLSKKVIMSGESCCCDKIYKTSLVKDNPDIRFPEDTIFENNLFLLKVMNNCKKLITSPNANYYWMKHEETLSQSPIYATKRLDDSYKVISQILDYIETLDTTREDNVMLIDFFMNKFGILAYKYYEYKPELTERINKLTLQ